MKKTLSLLALAALLAGCATTSTITNLTATQQPRNATGIYTIEAQWDTNQQTVKGDTLTPAVVVGNDFIPMRRVRKTTNRWEANVPVPADKDFLLYRFRFDYDYAKFGPAGRGSRTTGDFRLSIADNK